MPRFSERSESNLMTCDPRLVHVARKMILYVDHSIICGRRGKIEQEDAVRTGMSRVHWPDGAHNCAVPDVTKPRQEWKEDTSALSRAFDFSTYPVDWDDEKQFCYVAGQYIACARAEGIDLKWGGDWNRDGQGVWRDPKEKGALRDLGHLELAG